MLPDLVDTPAVRMLSGHRRDEPWQLEDLLADSVSEAKVHAPPGPEAMQAIAVDWVTSTWQPPVTCAGPYARWRAFPPASVRAVSTRGGQGTDPTVEERAPLPAEFFACTALSTLGLVLVVLNMLGVVDGDWVLYAGVALMLVFTAGEIYYLRRSSREQG